MYVRNNNNAHAMLELNASLESPMQHGQLGISLTFHFPATLFLVQSYGLYVVDARGGKFITTRPTCYVSKHTMVYDEGE